MCLCARHPDTNKYTNGMCGLMISPTNAYTSYTRGRTPSSNICIERERGREWLMDECWWDYVFTYFGLFTSARVCANFKRERVRDTESKCAGKLLLMRFPDPPWICSRIPLSHVNSSNNHPKHICWICWFSNPAMILCVANDGDGHIDSNEHSHL